MPSVIRDQVQAGQAFALRRRLTAVDGSGAADGGDGGKLVQRADVSSIAWAAYDLDAGGGQVGSGTLVPSAVIFDTLQTPWRADATGYTFAWTVPASVTAGAAGHVVVVVVTVTLTSGAAFDLLHELDVRGVAPGGYGD